jgi:sporulation protein YlmC with PRC-barrel domain
MKERPDFLDLARQVLDRQVVDSNHFPCGKVDDIEIEGKKKVRITALLIGNGAASERLPELAKVVSQKIFGRSVVRVPWSEVEVITHEIKLRSRAKDLKLDERTGLAHRLVSKLPGAWKK